MLRWAVGRCVEQFIDVLPIEGLPVGSHLLGDGNTRPHAPDLRRRSRAILNAIRIAPSYVRAGRMSKNASKLLQPREKLWVPVAFTWNESNTSGNRDSIRYDRINAAGAAFLLGSPAASALSRQRWQGTPCLRASISSIRHWSGTKSPGRGSEMCGRGELGRKPQDLSTNTLRAI
jgi:hypothetical protein